MNPHPDSLQTPHGQIAQVNDYDVRIVKLQGKFTWHRRFGSVSRDDRHDR
jgi:hypothetical protein